MKTFKLKVLGCDNGAGVMEVGGDLDVAKVSIDVTTRAGAVLNQRWFEQELGRHVVCAVFGGASPDAVRINWEDVRDLSCVPCGEHYIVSFESDDAGQSFVVCATVVEG